MYVCEVCHRKLCSYHHVVVTFGPCELCRQNAECFDCVSSAPVTKAEIQAQTDRKAWDIAIYRNVKQVKYTREKKEP